MRDVARTTLITSLGWVLAVVACGDPGPSSSGSMQVDTLSGGTVVITNGGEGRWSVRGESGWMLVEELRIGSLDGEYDAFGSVEALEVLPDGRIVVLDRGLPAVKVFGPSGTHLVTFSREGLGPGELRIPVSVSRGPDGNLWVGDVGADRFSVFTPEGQLVGTHRYPADEITGRGDFAIDGRFRDLSFRGLLVLDERLRPQESIQMPDFDGEFFRPPASGSSAGAFTVGAMRPVPFTARQVNALHPDGSVWVGVTDRYAIARLGPGGDTTRVIRRDGVEPLSVSDEERAEAIERLRPLIEGGSDVDLSRIPSSKPLFSRFLFSDEGHLWVEMQTEAGFSGGRWDVFDPEGAYLGAIETELAFDDMIFRDGYVIGVVTDDLDVEFVVRARIEIDDESTR